MISPGDVSILDLNTEELGIPTRDLMANAGMALADEIMDIRENGKVLFVIGSGNNGGDGLVAAKHLSLKGYETLVMMIGPVERIRSRLARDAFDDLPDEVEVMNYEGEIPLSDFIVDGLLGSGAIGEPRGDYREAIMEMNEASGIKVAIDIPSGIGSDICFKAQTTVTFHEIKSNMQGRPECGRIVVKDIGIPERAATYVGKGDLLRIPRKGADSHKGQTGKVLIIGGGPFTGAPVLSALAAIRTGSDLVRVAVPEGIWQVIASASPDLIVERLITDDPFMMGPEVIDQLDEIIDWADSILIGPGSGRSEKTLTVLSNLIRTCIRRKKRLVIDADGITAFSGIVKELRDVGDVLVTPHKKELQSILEGMGLGFDRERMDDPFKGSDEGSKWSIEAMDPLVRFTRITGCDLLVKGSCDVAVTSHHHSLDRLISHHPAYVRYVDRGVPEMSVGGTGDVLAGMCASFMAKGMSAFDSACLAAYVNGRSGEMTKEEIGISLSASAILERIPQVLSGSL